MTFYCKVSDIGPRACPTACAESLCFSGLPSSPLHSCFGDDFAATNPHSRVHRAPEALPRSTRQPLELPLSSVPPFSLNHLQALCTPVLDTILQPPIRGQLVPRICRKTPVGQAPGLRWALSPPIAPPESGGLRGRRRPRACPTTPRGSSSFNPAAAGALARACPHSRSITYRPFAQLIWTRFC